MASFENESTAMKFVLNIDDTKRTVSVSKISPGAAAETLDTVADAMRPLFVAEPSKVRRNMTDEIVK